MSAFSDVGSINALSSMMSDAQQAQAEREEKNVKNNQIGTVNIITPAEKKRIEQEKQLQYYACN